MLSSDRSAEIQGIRHKHPPRKPSSWTTGQRSAYLELSSMLIGAGSAHKITDVVNSLNLLLLSQFANPEQLTILQNSRPFSTALALVGGATFGYIFYNSARNSNSSAK
jgi:hypothetical protein